jgi:predicted enzyme related to lactoylglutathione lyase
MANPVTHFEINGKDKSRLEEFYKSTFEWQIQPVMEGYSLVFPGSGPNGGIGAMGADGVTFYVEVADVGAHLAKIEGLGGKKIMGPEQVPNGPIIGMFTDPEGHMIGLVQAGSSLAM